ncbi:hypothetical protein QJQ45_005000 [Haematococcus lacustris]|nr:hypothetical protein QJQ45_005000 [Haematococcus lacustris]
MGAESISGDDEPATAFAKYMLLKSRPGSRDSGHRPNKGFLGPFAAAAAVQPLQQQRPGSRGLVVPAVQGSLPSQPGSQASSGHGRATSPALLQQVDQQGRQQQQQEQGQHGEELQEQQQHGVESACHTPASSRGSTPHHYQPSSPDPTTSRPEVHHRSEPQVVAEEIDTSPACGRGSQLLGLTQAVRLLNELVAADAATAESAGAPRPWSRRSSRSGTAASVESHVPSAAEAAPAEREAATEAAALSRGTATPDPSQPLGFPTPDNQTDSPALALLIPTDSFVPTAAAAAAARSLGVQQQEPAAQASSPAPRPASSGARSPAVEHDTTLPAAPRASSPAGPLPPQAWRAAAAPSPSSPAPHSLADTRAGTPPAGLHTPQGHAATLSLAHAASQPLVHSSSLYLPLTAYPTSPPPPTSSQRPATPPSLHPAPPPPTSSSPTPQPASPHQPTKSPIPAQVPRLALPAPPSPTHPQRPPSPAPTPALRGTRLSLPRFPPLHPLVLLSALQQHRAGGASTGPRGGWAGEERWGSGRGQGGAPPPGAALAARPATCRTASSPNPITHSLGSGRLNRRCSLVGESQPASHNASHLQRHPHQQHTPQQQQQQQQQQLAWQLQQQQRQQATTHQQHYPASRQPQQQQQQQQLAGQQQQQQQQQATTHQQHYPASRQQQQPQQQQQQPQVAAHSRQAWLEQWAEQARLAAGPPHSPRPQLWEAAGGPGAKVAAGAGARTVAGPGAGVAAGAWGAEREAVTKALPAGPGAMQGRRPHSPRPGDSGSSQAQVLEVAPCWPSALPALQAGSRAVGPQARSASATSASWQGRWAMAS